jgi:tetratricopeptide (TPR) repeat protein
MPTQPQLNLQEIYDALVYTGSKWRPWLWWSLSGAAGGALGGVASFLVPDYRVWVALIILALVAWGKKWYGLLERRFTARSVQGTVFFSAAFWIAFIVPLYSLSARHSLILGAVVICGGAVVGYVHSIILIGRVRRFYLWMGSGATCGALAAAAGVLAPWIANAPLSNPQSNALVGALVGSLYCALLGGALLWVFWDSSIFFSCLGHLYFEEEQLADAAATYSLAISIQPGDAELYYNRGTVLARLGQHEQAIVDFDKALTLNPSDAKAYANRAMAYSDLDEPALAFADYSNALSLDPTDANTYTGRGHLYVSLGDLTAALAEFDRAIELEPGDAMAYSNRGATYSKLGNVPRAIEDYGSAIQHEPGYANSYANRAFAYYKLGEYEKGIADCEQALKMRPDHAATYSNRGLCHAALGDAEHAAADFRRALELPCPDVVYEEAINGLRALGLAPDQR